MVMLYFFTTKIKLISSRSFIKKPGAPVNVLWYPGVAGCVVDSDWTVLLLLASK